MPGKDKEREAEGGKGEDALAGQLLEANERNQELMTRLKYAQADLENFRKRADRELAEAGEAPLRGLAGKLVVVLDEMELAIRHAEEGADSGELVEGIKMVERNLAGALESAGLERIQSVGRPFDPSIHEAIEKVQGKSAGQDVVVEELRPGFTFRGRLLRPSMVKVELASQAPAEEASQ